MPSPRTPSSVATNPTPPVFHFEPHSDPPRPLALHIVLFCSNRRLFVGLFAPGEVDAGEDNGGADELTDPEVFAEQQYAGAHAGEGDEVLVDEDMVAPTRETPQLQAAKPKAEEQSAE